MFSILQEHVRACVYVWVCVCVCVAGSHEPPWCERVFVCIDEPTNIYIYIYIYIHIYVYVYMRTVCVNT